MKFKKMRIDVHTLTGMDPEHCNIGDVAGRHVPRDAFTTDPAAGPTHSKRETTSTVWHGAELGTFHHCVGVCYMIFTFKGHFIKERVPWNLIV